MRGEFVQRSVGTHDGPFHADEVTACALLLLYQQIDADKIVRTRLLSKLKACEYICDVGGVYNPGERQFDHHQAEYQGLLSSAGMILQYFCDKAIIDREEYDFLNDSLILGIDAHDNGRMEVCRGVCTFSQVISNILPESYDAKEDDFNAAFNRALEFAHGHLLRLRSRHRYTLAARQAVAACMERSKECLVFDSKLPWLDNFFALGGEQHPALFVIMPSGDHWKLRGIPPDAEQRMKVRMPLPLEWAGLLEEDLKRVSGIPGAVFCHKGRFISVWQTKEDALKALKYTLTTGER